MPTTSTYYLNAPSLASATAVFLNAELTSCAPDGFYTDGLTRRQQVGCVLLPSQVCPECPPISYNCISGDCIDPGDGTGTYATLEECDLMCPPPSISLGTAICRYNNCNDNAACTVEYGISTSNAPVGAYITLTTDLPSSTATVTIINSSAFAGRLSYFEPSGSATPVYFTLELRTSGGTVIATSSTSLTHQSFWAMLPLCTIPVTYNCVSGTCVDPMDGTGTYSTLVDCEAACTPPPVVSYNCVSGTCVDPGDGSGTYPTLGDCEFSCTPLGTSYECSGLFCIEVEGTGGEYPTLEDCIEGCGGTVITYDCVSGDCFDPGDGSGTYATLIDCEAACAPAPINVIGLSANAVDELGEISITSTVTTDVGVDVDTIFTINVMVSTYGLVVVYVTILTGNTSGTGQTSLGLGSLPTVIDACISGIDNPSISVGGFVC